MTARARKAADAAELDVTEPNPALVPEPESTEPVSRDYVVSGSRVVCVDGTDHEPGESFTAVLAPDLEAFLLGIGALTITDSSPTTNGERKTESRTDLSPS